MGRNEIGNQIGQDHLDRDADVNWRAEHEVVVIDEVEHAAHNQRYAPSATKYASMTPVVETLFRRTFSMARVHHAH